MADRKVKKLSKTKGFLMQTKKGIKKTIENVKSKRRVKKLLKSGNQKEKVDSSGQPVYKHGGIIQHD